MLPKLLFFRLMEIVFLTATAQTAIEVLVPVQVLAESMGYCHLVRCIVQMVSNRSTLISIGRHCF